jgi:hypothetical protein
MQRKLVWPFTAEELWSAECIDWYVAKTIQYLGRHHFCRIDSRSMTVPGKWGREVAAVWRQARTGARLFAKLFFLTDDTCAGNE